jgi:hypothetical protein
MTIAIGGDWQPIGCDVITIAGDGTGSYVVPCNVKSLCLCAMTHDDYFADTAAKAAGTQKFPLFTNKPVAFNSVNSWGGRTLYFNGTSADSILVCAVYGSDGVSVANL